MDSLEEYYQQQLAIFEQHRASALENLRARLREELRATAEKSIAMIQARIEQNNEEASRRFTKGMAELDEQRGTWPPILIEANEALIKKMLEGTLEINRKLLDGFIEVANRISERR